MREWKMVRGNKIELETKDDCKKRMGRSPDLFDCAVVLTEAARQRGFKIARMAAVSSSKPKQEFMERLKERSETLARSHELTYK